MNGFTYLTCSNRQCGVRFPRLERDPAVAACPRCGAPLVESDAGRAAGEHHSPIARVRLPLALLVDNVRSGFNVGSMLRSADSAGVVRVILCGLTPTPLQPQVAKTALGAERALDWMYLPNARMAADLLLAAGGALWVLEEGPGAVSLFDAPLPTLLSVAAPLTLVVGNEVVGVDPALRALAAATVCLPMRGRKRSLNVAVACGVALVVLGERLAAEKHD